MLSLFRPHIWLGDNDRQVLIDWRNGRLFADTYSTDDDGRFWVHAWLPLHKGLLRCLRDREVWIAGHFTWSWRWRVLIGEFRDMAAAKAYAAGLFSLEAT